MTTSRVRALLRKSGRASFLHPRTHLLQRVPPGLTSSKSDIQDVLSAINEEASLYSAKAEGALPSEMMEALKRYTSHDEWLQHALKCLPSFEEHQAVSFISHACDDDCLSVSDMQAILGNAIQFHAIAEDNVLPYLQEDPLYGGGKHISPMEGARLLEVLLFIAELHDPSIDRLRIARRKYNVLCSSLGYDPTSRGEFLKYTNSPVQICTQMVEKEFYNSGDALVESKKLLSLMPFPYWAFSCPTDGKQMDDYWLIAFDKDYNYIPKNEMLTIIQNTKCVQDAMKREKESRHKYSRCRHVDPLQEHVRTLKCQADGMCQWKGLSIIGTPFMTPASELLHVVARQVIVTGGEYITAYIPSFLVGNHLSTLINEEFVDLDMLMGRLGSKLSGKEDDEKEDILMRFAAMHERRRLRVKKPKPNDNTLSEDEIQFGADCVWSAMRGSGVSRFSSFEYVTQIVAPWWIGEETLERKLKRFLPGSSGDKKHKSMTADEILNFVTEKIGVDVQSGNRRYLWARFCRERARTATNQRKIRNKGNKVERSKKK